MPRLLPAFSALALLCAAAPQAAVSRPVVASGKLDPTPRTIVITAFEPEWVALESAVQQARSYRVNGLLILTGRIAGKPVVLLQSGVSMVNAAMTTQLVIDRFNARRIVFSGIAGGVDPSLAVGDVVVADQWAEYMEVALGRKVGDRYVSPDREAITDPLPGYGMMIPRDVRVGNAKEPPRRRRWFDADPGLLALARTVGEQTALAQCLPPGETIPQTPGVSETEGRCLDHTPRVVVGGHGISGPAFADNAEYRQYLFANFHAQVLDMETAATAHVAYANQVPFIAFRSLSDLAGGDSGANQSWVFGRLAARNAASVVTRYVAALPN